MKYISWKIYLFAAIVFVTVGCINWAHYSDSKCDLTRSQLVEKRTYCWKGSCIDEYETVSEIPLEEDTQKCRYFHLLDILVSGRTTPMEVWIFSLSFQLAAGYMVWRMIDAYALELSDRLRNEEARLIP